MTLKEIGDMFGVSRERVRQVMEKYGLERIKNRIHKNHSCNYHTSLRQYFNHVKETLKENNVILLRLIKKKKCRDCGSKENLHTHHLKYPATSLKDIQILCASCHMCRHRKGNDIKKQLEICKQYLQGESGKRLARKYNTNFNLIYHILRKWNIKRRPRFFNYKKDFT